MASATASSSEATVMMAPNSSQPSRAMACLGSRLNCRSTSSGDGIGQALFGGDENGLGPCPVLGLGDEIGGDPGGIGRAIGDDEHFGGAGDHVDADLAEDLALGGGDIGIAGADDLVDRLDGGGAIGERARRPGRRRRDRFR